MKNKRPRPVKHPELWAVNQIWSESECFIFGGGYSVIRQFGLDPRTGPTTREEYKALGDELKPYFEGKRVIGVNNAFMLGDWIDVAFWGDKAQYFNYKNAYDDFSGLKVTCHPFYDKNALPGKNIKYVKRHRAKRTGLTSKRKFVVWNFNSGSCAINLARHLGAKTIYLLGFDMFTDPEFNRSHWHSGYPNKQNTPTIGDRRRGKTETIRVKRKTTTPPYNRHMKGFVDLAIQAKNLDLEIINLSPDSKIDVFPKMKVFDVLGEKLDITEMNDENKILMNTLTGEIESITPLIQDKEDNAILSDSTHMEE